MVKFKYLALISVLIILTLTGLNFVSAAGAKLGGSNFTSTSAVIINRTVNSVVNFTIVTNESSVAVIYINLSSFNLTNGVRFVNASNSTTITAANNVTGVNDGSQLIVIQNTSANALVGVNSTKDFSFNITSTAVGIITFNITTKLINVSDNVSFQADGKYNSSLLKKVVNFAFSGYAVNDTGQNESNVNVSIYQFVQGVAGPPTETFEASTVTGATGRFDFASVNGSASQYKLKIIRYGSGACVSYNVSCNATKVGTIIPPFPGNMFYPQPGIESITNNFMKPPTLNGTNFYLESAATINISAYNGTLTNTSQRFGYEVMEQKTGFPVESNVRTNVTNAKIVVPINRNYTVMLLRDPYSFAGGRVYANGSKICGGAFMNGSDCPTPPMSNSTINPTTEGQFIELAMNLATTRYYLYGCLEVTGNDTAVNNVTAIIPRLIPWTGFVPPGATDMSIASNLDNASLINYSAKGAAAPAGFFNCTGKLAYYNISLMNSAYLLEFYATNTTNTTDNQANSKWLAAFQNITMSADTNMNITLRPLAGYGNSSFYQSGGPAREGNQSSKITVQFINSSGGIISSDSPHVEVYIKNSSLFGELHYIIETTTGGNFSIPILNESTAKVRIFSNQGPPIEQTLNLSIPVNNITLVTMTGGDAGFRGYNSTSGKCDAKLDVSSTPIQMKFIRYSSSCNVLEPDSTCVVTEMNASDFNPMKALVAGKVNMEMLILSTGVRLTFVNYDMFSAKQPPMNTLMSENSTSRATSTATSTEIWRFGSFVPSSVYDYVIIKIPYNGTSTASNYINDSWQMNASVPLFYDESGNVIWNKTRGDTALNMSSDFIDYNSSTLYRNLTIGGIICDKNETNLSVSICYVNTTSNAIYMQIPHFTELGSDIYAGAAALTSDSNPPGGSSSPLSEFWKTPYVVNDYLFEQGYTRALEARERIQVRVNGITHYAGIISLTETTATINVSSASQQKTLSVGEEWKAEVTGDSYYDIYMKLNSIANSRANVTFKLIHESTGIPPLIEPEKCGNNAIDTGENCGNCAADVKCADDETCEVATCVKKTTPPAETKSIFKSVWFWIVVVVIIAALVYYFYFLKPKRYYKKGY